jgi:hypothetical protein
VMSHMSADASRMRYLGHQGKASKNTASLVLAIRWNCPSTSKISTRIARLRPLPNSLVELFRVVNFAWVFACY